MTRRSKKITRLKSILDAPTDYLRLRHDRERAVYQAAFWEGVETGIRITLEAVRDFAELRKLPGHPWPSYHWLADILGLGGGPGLDEGAKFLRWLDKRIIT